MKRYTLKTWLLMLVFVLLPWQTRWIFGQATILGEATPFGVLSVHAVEVLVLVTALVTLLRKQDRPEIPRAYRLPIGLTFGIFAMSALTLTWTEHIDVSLNQLFHVGSAMVLFLLMIDRNVPVRPLLASFALGLVAPLWLGIAQVVFDASPAFTLFGLAERNVEHLGDAVTIAQDGSRQLRAYGSFPHPNIFGGYIAVGLLAVIAVLWDRAKKDLFLAVGLFAAGLALTASRSAALGLMLGMFLSGLVLRMKDTAKARIAVIPIAIFVIAGALFGTFAVPDLAASLRGGGATEERSIDERAVQYAAFPTVIGGGYLLSGHGLGTYPFVMADILPTSEVWDYQPIHNVPLLIIGEIGLLGALVVIAWSSSIDRINFARFPQRDAVMAFAMGNVVLVILFFDHYLWSQWSGLALLAFVMAMTVRMGEPARG